jgi:hypothetical protein
MSDLELFKQKCIDWLEPLGYSITSSSMDRIFIFTRSDQYSPAIICRLNLDGRQTCELQDNHSHKLFITISTGQMAFHHPKIQKYIDTFVHYAKLAEQYPPF